MSQVIAQQPQIRAIRRITLVAVALVLALSTALGVALATRHTATTPVSTASVAHFTDTCPPLARTVC